MNLRGVGDRWLAGEPIDGVALAMHDRVAIAMGPHANGRGIILLLLGLKPQPTYLIRLASGGEEIRVRQSALRRLTIGEAT